VGVGPDRVQVALRAAGVGEVLLADEDEGALRHPAAVDLAFAEGDLGEGATDVDGAGAAGGLVRPGHPALDGEVELEGGGTVLEAAVGAGGARREAVAGQFEDAARRQVGRRRRPQATR